MLLGQLKTWIHWHFNPFVCLCWGLTSQSTIFQSCLDGATASWVINQYFLGVKCLAQRHNTAAVGFEPPTSRSGVRHSTTEPPLHKFNPFGRTACYHMQAVLPLITSLCIISNVSFGAYAYSPDCNQTVCLQSDHMRMVCLHFTHFS